MPDLDEDVIDLRGGEARYYGVKPPSTYGYDAVVPEAWRQSASATSTTAPAADNRREQPSATRSALPRRFRLGRRFPPLQRVVHYGPVDGADVDVKLTVALTMRLHTTGIEHPIRDLEGRLRDADYLQLLTDSFGRDRRSLGSTNVQVPRTLLGAKREWHTSIVAGRRHGFAISDRHLVLLEYLSPERDLRRRTFGIAYKRIVVAYEIVADDADLHPRQSSHNGAW